ncbi:glycoside hydrolase family 30 protein [Sediminibacterium soli]|uniref:glycoside hydrolase family 30 protein n=1 Tax=Sediminibacterium soli TaxID=2698829 RepID=UPI001379AE10|nr:glycoside hydrolase family 30 beta sandwich domain-containing protein [Sediminibacterium soli]NCI45641.1 glucosylceramidase [Sediminibacterium soli]
MKPISSLHRLIYLLRGICFPPARIAAASALWLGCGMARLPAQTAKVESWLTDPAAAVFFVKQAPVTLQKSRDTATITIDPAKKFQSVQGFGFALTGGSAMHMMKMSPTARAALIRELFATDGSHIGTSYLRVSIGASDLNEYVFSYDDLPAGQTDTGLVHFDLGPDKRDVIPVLQEIRKVNPRIRIMGSPWSPPAWMKTNDDTKGGSLKPQYYGVYARYFVKYIQAMKKHGIDIDAITVQNEPLHPGNNPSLYMPAGEQALFVKKYLGPAFAAAAISTRIIIYDHNADKPEYPISILDDPEARKYIDGSAFHLYGGRIEALSKVHDAHPDRHLYFTEQWVGAPGNFTRDIREHIDKLIIGASRNWSRTVIEWNLAADPQQQPHTDRGGCTGCLGAVTIDKDSITRNPAYYIIAHAAKWVRPGSVRVWSNMPEELPNVAFQTVTGKTILIALNTAKDERVFTVACKGRRFAARLGPGAVASYILN